MIGFPTRRLRRLRASRTLRDLLADVRLSRDDFVAPLFVTEGQGVRREIATMPGQCQFSADTALEAARRCRQRGAERVTVVLRDTDDAPAGAGLEAEGIRLLTGTAVEQLHGTADRLTGLTLRDLASGDAANVLAGTLVLASGRMPELVFQPDRPETAAGEEAPAAASQADGAWTAHPPYKASLVAADAMGLFSEADVLSDFPGAIKAIAAGRRAAASAHRLVYDERLALPADVLTPDAAVQNVSRLTGVPEAAREIMPLASAEALAAGSEIELSFDDAAARREAARCLQCGLICYRHTAQAGHDAPVEVAEVRSEG